MWRLKLITGAYEMKIQKTARLLGSLAVMTTLFALSVAKVDANKNVSSQLQSSATMPAFDNSSQMRKWELKSCEPTNKKCLVVRAHTAESGQMTSILTFSNAEIEIIESGKIEKSKANFGYIDFENNSLVARVSSSREIAFSLRTLNKRIFTL